MGEVCFGVLELYRRVPGSLDTADARVIAVALEAMAGVALEELIGPAETPEQPHSWPGRLSAAHARVHQAAGMVAVHLDLSVDDALARMRATAYSQTIPLPELADSVITGHTRLGRDTPP